MRLSCRASIILPCLVTMMLVVSSFLLPPTAGEKITLNAICFLGTSKTKVLLLLHLFTPPRSPHSPSPPVCCLYLLHLQSSLPAMSDHIPLILLFYSNTAALVG